MSAAVEIAKQTWAGALAGIPDQRQWIAEQLQVARQTPGLSMDGRELLRVAQPRFMDPGAWAADQAVVAAVTSALDAAAEWVLQPSSSRHHYLGPWADDERILDLFSLPTGYTQRVAFGRFDGVRTHDGLRILEFNGGLPGGTASAAASALLMSTWPSFAAVDEVLDIEVPDVRGALVDALTAVWHSFGGTGVPRSAFVVPREFQPHVAGQMQVMLATMQSRGIDATTCDPGELVRKGGRVYGPDGIIDVAVRVFFTSMLPALGSRIDTMVEAVRAGELCMVTSFRAGLLGHKSLFAVITDPDIDLAMPADSLDLARAHLPWTRIATDGPTMAPGGESIDLRRYALDHADKLVLKPADGTGGAGVMLGWEHDAAAWREALEGAWASPETWILQERLPLAIEEFPLLDEGFPVRHFQTDHNPLVFNDQIGGYFVRLSETGGITNMSTGDGTVAPVYAIATR